MRDYCEIAIGFGYMVLFAAAFPLAGTMLYVSDVVDIKFDMWRIFHLQQRPVPRGMEDIGSWYDVQIDAVITSPSTSQLSLSSMSLLSSSSSSSSSSSISSSISSLCHYYHYHYH
jgi:hypothetical protein